MKQKKTNYFLVLLGILFVLFFALFYYSFQEHSKANEKSKYYHLNLDFTNPTGIFKGSIVSINGVPVGEVISTRLDENETATVVVAVERKYKLPTDSVASVYTDGLLGASYINITPGAMDEYFSDDETMEYTQNTLPIMDFIRMLVGRIKIEK